MKIIQIPIPEKCDICREPIKIYQPYYSVRATKTIGGMKVGFMNQLYLCTNCFDAYQDFITERMVQENHKQTMKELRK